MELDTLFKALADTTRLRCLMLLMEFKELCVCELTEPLSLAQPKVSRHLAALRASNLVVSRKEGLWVHYRVNEELPGWVLEVMQASFQGCRLTQPFVEDRQRLLAGRGESGQCVSKCC
ncbi:MAG: metalloregulator ArsR/SmtB family transcription factor [Magnetococcales bacterium]|nr:metalloregulator ArsR/SmtB family transcription factor [Magnetococcales bacterium]